MQCWTLSIWFKTQYCISIKPKDNEIFAIAEDIYTFDNFIPHILDIKIHPDGLSIYFKDTNTGQYTRYNNFFPIAQQNILNLHRGCQYFWQKQTNLCTRTEEHALSDRESSIYDHINNCSYYSYIENVFLFNIDPFDKVLFSINSVTPK